MKVIVDRIEENFLVVELENGKVFNIPREIMPEAREGDLINIKIDKNETKKRDENIKALMNDIFKD